MQVVTLVRRPVDGTPRVDDFALVEQALPARGPGQLLVRNVVMSVDPSMRGRLETSEKQYTTNFEIGGPLDGSCIGIVTETDDAAFPVGTAVRHRAGWRDLALIEASSATAVDPAKAPLGAWLGVLGQTGFTAWAGIRRIAPVEPGNTVFVSAAAGAVGSAVGEFSRLLGATTIIGSAGGAAKARLLTDELGFTHGFDYRTESAADVLPKAAPGGIDVYFDNAGGRQLVAALHNMKLHGHIAMCGMMTIFDQEAKREDINQLMEAILRRVSLRGFIVRDHEDLRSDFETHVSGWLRDGRLAPRQTVVDGLEHAAEAFLSMLGGGNVGKMLVRLDSSVAV
jgi:NADPH-dependent curcumin reductase CurA